MKLKVCAYLLVFSLLFTVVSIAYDGIPYQNAYDYLMDQGIPTSYLDRRTELQIQQLYNIVVGKEIEFGGSSITYLSADGDQIHPYGAIPQSDMALEISTLYKIGHDSAGRNTYEECYVTVYYGWTTNHPAVKKMDAITVNWDKSVFTFKSGSFDHTDYSDKGVEYSGVTRPAKSNQGGLGYYAYLSPSGKNLSGSTYFTLLPTKTPMYAAGTIGPHLTTSINVHYAHDRNPLSVQGVSLSVDGVGISINMGSLTDEASASYVRYYNYTPQN